MNRPARLTPEARQDLLNALRWYEGQSPGLGSRFLDEVDATIEDVSHRPGSFPTVYRDLRRAILPHFPYGVFFRESQAQVTVVGVLDLRRHPRTWRRR